MAEEDTINSIVEKQIIDKRIRMEKLMKQKRIQSS